MAPLSFDNPWVRSVDGGQRRWPSWVAAMIAALALTAGLAGGAALYAQLSADGGSSLAGQVLDRALLTALVIGPMVLPALISGPFYERRAVRSGAVGWPAGAVLGVTFGGLGLLVAVGLIQLAHGVSHEAAGAASNALALALPATALLTLAQAGGEEVLFRGWLQPQLAARLGPRVGLLLTSLLFAAVHAWGSEPRAVALVNIFLAGLVFGLLALRTGGLAAPVAAHFAWNWLEQHGLGLAPNPGVDPLGAIVDLQLTGPDWLSGGADALNGSLLATLVLGLQVAGLLLWRSGRARN